MDKDFVNFSLICIISIFYIHLVLAISPALILTPYIKQNRIEQRRNLSQVDPNSFLGVTSYSGFLTVDERYNSNMFFWYFPVADKPLNMTPWIIWLQGGPGASSLAGLFDEIGPFEVVNENLKLREMSWTREYSMVFIDNPVGAGFSFTNSQDGFAKDMDTYSNHLYQAVVQLVTVYPELRTAPLYVAGESYAGHYVPGFGAKALEENAKKSAGEVPFDLKGLIMGNPVLDRESIMDYVTVFYHWGLIDRQGVIAVTPLQEQYIQAIKNGDGNSADEIRGELINKLQSIVSQPMYNFLRGVGNLQAFEGYINDEYVREAIHVGTIKFTFNNASVATKLISHPNSEFLTKVTPKMNKLLEHYRVLIYCGQLDLRAPCVPTAEYIRRELRWSHREQFLKAPRVPWRHNDSIAGYVKSGGGFTEVLVQGAGHLAPIDKPAEVKQLVSYFIRGLDLDLPSNFNVNDVETPEYTEMDNITSINDTSGLSTGLTASLCVNVILVLSIIVMVVLFMRWKRKSEDFFYSPLSDGILTMT